MSYELRFHIPESVDSDTKERLIRMLTRECGGTTTYEYRGTWVDGDVVMAESGEIVTCVTDTESYGKADDMCDSYNDWLKRNTDESAIMSDVRECNVVID